VGWAIDPHCHSCGNLHSWPVCFNEFSSGHWPASGIGGHKCGCLVDAPLNMLHHWLWVVLCPGMPQTAGRRATSSSLYLFDVCPCLDIMAVGRLLLAWSSRKSIGIFMFPGLESARK
jgi:hypothetical protein